VSRLSAALALLLAACGSDPVEPTWIDLAKGFTPRPLAQSARAWPSKLSSGSVARVVEEDGRVWIEATLEREAWIPESRPGAWSALRPWEASFSCTGSGAVRVFVDGAELVQGLGHEQDPSGLFYLNEERLFLATGSQEPPSAVDYRVAADHGNEENGLWRVRTLDHVGAGIPVYPLLPEERTAVVPEESVLRFRTVFERLPHGLAEASGGPTPSATFRVLANGEVVFEGANLGNAEAHCVPLAAGRTTLRFEVIGDPGRAVFQVPSIGPAEVGDYRARPWGRSRPNLVLFIADTFRADNMEMYGGRPELTPELNAFARRSLCFARARSTAAWTLPSISSILTGLFPPQHGATLNSLSVSRELTTLAETLAQNGYRTVAVTDSGFFSPPFGLDQGFELFYENRIHHWNLTKSVDQALDVLWNDDGRPLFLVVHTYRAHGPFRTGPEEDITAFEEFLKKGAEIMALQEDRLLETRKEALLPHLAEWVALYEEGVKDLDFKFGRFLREATGTGVLDNGVLAFCGDHGQAHGENRDVAHGGKLWESKLRVPLLLHGAGIEPGTRETLASLIDVAPTFGAMSGVPSSPDWVGTSLLALPKDRPTFAFRLEGPEEDEVTVQLGAHKICALPDADALRRGEVLEAYDLGTDPGERENLRQAAAWPGELAREMADAIEIFLHAKSSAGGAELDPDMSRRLQDIGYGGN